MALLRDNQYLQSRNHISPCGCQRADLFFQSMEISEEHLSPGAGIAAETQAPLITRERGNGGPDWTRTSDPTLIKRVL
jgi:hypothetical protein